jgi:hypothetical protein
MTAGLKKKTGGQSAAANISSKFVGRQIFYYRLAGAKIDCQKAI